MTLLYAAAVKEKKAQPDDAARGRGLTGREIPTAYIAEDAADRE